jgi:hypothetical protein
MTILRAARFLGLAGCLLLASACSSTGTASSSPSPFGSPPLISVLGYSDLVECAIHRGLIQRSILNSEGDFSTWYLNGRIIADNDFAEWWNAEQETVIEGKTLEQWLMNTEQRQELPAQVCGTTAMPSPSPSI